MSRVWRTWAVLVLFALGTSLITPLIPLYQDQLGFGDTVVTLFLGCYVITLVPSMLSLGQLSDRVGRKRVLLIAIATLAVAQVILIAEPPLPGLLAARAIQGLATARVAIAIRSTRLRPTRSESWPRLSIEGTSVIT